MSEEIVSDRICAVCGCDATFGWEYQEDGRVRHEWLTACVAALRIKNKQLCTLLAEADERIDPHAPLCALGDGYGDPCSCDYPDIHKRIKAALEAAGGEMATCKRCGGTGIIITCFDDICNGIGHCIHGDGEEFCPNCHGEGDELEDYDDFGIEEGYSMSPLRCRWCGSPLVLGRCAICDVGNVISQRA